jgi:hypothetical protein
MDQYSKYKEGGLRQKIHQAIRSKQCIRCWSSEHLRSSCPEPPKKWEEDFNKGKAAFWGPKPKQLRTQWLCAPGPDRVSVRPSSQVLYSVDSGMVIALDTGSEISIGQIGHLKNIRLVRKPVFVEGIGGICVFDKIGDLLLAGNRAVTVFAVDKGDLPPDFHALLGTSHLQELGISLDYALQHPGCPLVEAIAFKSSLPFPATPLSLEFGLFSPIRALFSGGGTVLAPLILLTALVAPLSSSASLTLEPQVLVWFGFALLSVFLLLVARFPAAEREATITQRAPPRELCQLAPALSSTQRDSFVAASRDFAHVFANERPSGLRLGGTQGRTFPYRLASRLPAASTRWVPAAAPLRDSVFARRSPHAKAIFSARKIYWPERMRRNRVKARARDRFPRHAPLAARTVSLDPPTYGRPPGPRGWTLARPLASPGVPMVESWPSIPTSPPPHIFDPVPGLEFSLQREVFGAVASVPEKLRLLSRPKSHQSAQALAVKPLRSFMMQVVRDKRARNHSPPVAPIQLVPRPAWMQDTPSYHTKEEADRIWRQGTRTLLGEPPLSPSSFTGGNTLKVLAEVEHPRSGRCETKLALDTQSDVTTCLREFLSDIRPIIRDTVSGCGGSADFDEEGTLHVYSQSQQQLVALPALVAPKPQLRSREIAPPFLGSPHSWNWK